MSTWVTVVVGVLAGLGSGSLGTIVSARLAAQHDSRMRLRDLTVIEYAKALAAVEEVFHVTYSRYDELQKRIDKGAGEEQLVRREVDDIRAATAARQAPAKLLGSPAVEQAMHDFNTVLGQRFVRAIKQGQGQTVKEELDTIHDRLLAEMQSHLRILDDPKWRLSWLRSRRRT